MMNKDKFTPEKAVEVRQSLGLTQRDVAYDIREMTSGAISIDNTKLSRFERGVIQLSDKALKKLVEYYERKAVEKGHFKDEEVEAEEAVEVEAVEEETEQAEVVEQPQPKKPANVVKLEKRRKSVVDDDFGKEAIKFDKNIDPDVRQALIYAFGHINDKIDESLEYRAKKGLFGYSDDDDEKALQLVFDMAAAYNVVRTLQGRPVFPAFRPDEPVFEKGELLHVIQSSYPDYAHWLFLEGEDAEETPEEQKQGSL